jgi:prophage DNA circulation protein
MTARPLPRLLPYQFARVMPTLVLAQRLYADASRADEIRAENHVVHPLFCPLTGFALSA